MRRRSDAPSVATNTCRPVSTILRARRPISGCSKGSGPPIHTTGAELARIVLKQSHDASGVAECGDPAKTGSCRSSEWRIEPRRVCLARPEARSAVSPRGNRINDSKSAAQVEFARQKFHRDIFFRSLRLVSEARQRVERK